MRPIPIHEETIQLGENECKIAWLCREMNKGMVGADDHEIFHNLVMHFHIDDDPTVMDRLRIAWQRSGLNAHYALERYPPEMDNSEDYLNVPVFTAILEHIDEWAAQALKEQFIGGLQDTYSAKPSAQSLKADREFVEAPEEAGATTKAEAEDDEDEEREPTYDPHGVGLKEVPNEDAEPEYDPHGTGLQEMPDNNPV